MRIVTMPADLGALGKRAVGSNPGAVNVPRRWRATPNYMRAARRTRSSATATDASTILISFRNTRRGFGPNDRGAGRAVQTLSAVQASLNGRLNAHPFTAFLAVERFDGAEAGEGVQRPAMRTPLATNLVGCKLHQPRAAAVKRNSIDHRAARVAFEIGHIATFLDDEATVALRASGDFVGDDQVLAFVFVLGHLGLRADRPRRIPALNRVNYLNPLHGARHLQRVAQAPRARGPHDADQRHTRRGSTTRQTQAAPDCRLTDSQSGPMELYLAPRHVLSSAGRWRREPAMGWTD